MHQILFDPDNAILVILPLKVTLGIGLITIGANFVISTQIMLFFCVFCWITFFIGI